MGGIWLTKSKPISGDYHDLYLRTDVQLLGDVFKTIRVTSMTQYGLDPAHYCSALAILLVHY